MNNSEFEMWMNDLFEIKDERPYAEQALEQVRSNNYVSSRMPWMNVDVEWGDICCDLEDEWYGSITYDWTSADEAHDAATMAQWEEEINTDAQSIWDDIRIRSRR